MELISKVRTIAPYFGVQLSGSAGHRLCETCMSVWAMLILGHFEDDDVGTVDLIYQNRACALCRLVRTILESSTRDTKACDGASGNVESEEQAIQRVQAWAGGARVLLGSRSLDGWRVSVILARETGSVWLNEISFVGDTKVRPENIFPLDRKLVNRVKRQEVVQVHGGETVSMQQIHGWLAECESTHGAHCNGREIAPMRHAGIIDLNLIDVEDMCIVPGTSDQKYITLSHVWGKEAPILQFTTNRVSFFSQKGSLLTCADDLPVAIRDSILLAKQLHVRYLWADALCIVQDDLDEKALLISLMDIVYTRAFLTVVSVAASDSSYPLAGLRKGTRVPMRHVGYAHGRYLISEPPELSTAFSESTYHTRAWTYQEQILSCRCLYFTKYRVYFHCMETLWEENSKQGALESDASHVSSTSRTFINPLVMHVDRFRLAPGLAPSPDAVFTAYQALVQEYTMRNLTDPADILDAFAGLAAVLEQLLGTGEPGTCLYGLLSSLLDLCLLWYPTSPPTRHESSKVSMPSWSWAGWHGNVRYIEIHNSGIAHHHQSWAIAPRDKSPPPKPLAYWSDPHIPEYQRALADDVGLKPKITAFQILTNGMFQTVWRQRMQLLELPEDTGVLPEPLPAARLSAIRGLPALYFRTLAVPVEAVRIIVLKRKTPTDRHFGTAIFSLAGSKVGTLHGFEHLQNMCPNGEACGECHYVEVSGDTVLVGRAGKWDYSEYRGPGRHLSPFMHVCLDQEAKGPCEFIALSAEQEGVKADGRVRDKNIFVMLIRWVGRGVAERITIGVIDGDAWRRLEKREKNVLLV